MHSHILYTYSAALEGQKLLFSQPESKMLAVGCCNKSLHQKIHKKKTAGLGQQYETSRRHCLLTSVVYKLVCND